MGGAAVTAQERAAGWERGWRAGAVSWGEFKGPTGAGDALDVDVRERGQSGRTPRLQA